ncbi:MAG: hypothetical protein DI562_16050 [Stenotrophomonas acidaminiphila]|nr:MAG: hypothetical protein DI562_16050 [Stenotrophomonas acidaminiphila]
MIETPLKKTRYLLLAGVEWRFTIKLPYCTKCSASASRFPVSVGKKLLVSAVVFVAIMLVVALVQPNLGRLLDYVPAAAGLLSIAASFGYYALRGRKAPQTSYSQPVTLSRLKQTFSGDVVSLTLRCSRPEFANKLSALNTQYVESGILIVEHV